MEDALIHSTLVENPSSIEPGGGVLEPYAASLEPVYQEILEADLIDIHIDSEAGSGQVVISGGDIVLESSVRKDDGFVDEILEAGQPIVLSSSIDQILHPSNISPVLLDAVLQDPLGGGFQLSEQSLMEEGQPDLIPSVELSPQEIDQLDIHLDGRSGELLLVSLNPESIDSGSAYSDDLQDWIIDQIIHDDIVLDLSNNQAFAIDLAVPDLTNYQEEKVYIQARLDNTSQGSAVNIEVFDNRGLDIDLTGLSLNVGWNKKRLLVDANSFDTKNVFQGVTAPLFQSTGDIQVNQSEGGVEQQLITGLSAASLPLAGTGQPFGKSSSQGEPVPTLFSSIPVVELDSSNPIGFQFSINEAIQSGGSELSPHEVVFVTTEQETAVLHIDQSKLTTGEYIVDARSSANLIKRFRVTVDGPTSETSLPDLSLTSPQSTGVIPESSSVELSLKEADSLTINSSEVDLVAPGLWKQSVSLYQDQAPWQLDLEQLFPDAEQRRGLDVLVSGKLPSWLTYSHSASNPSGLIRGTPTNSDIGLSTTQWSFVDSEGQTATLLIDFQIDNKNDAPVAARAAEPILLSVDNLDHNQSEPFLERIDLSNLFSDPDKRWGDHLEFSIAQVKSLSDNRIIEADWLRITNASTALPALKNNVDLRPRLSRIGLNGEREEIGIDDISKLDKGALVQVDVMLADNRDDVERGLIAVDVDLSISSSLLVQPESVELSPSLPLFQKSSISTPAVAGDYTALSLQAGSLPRFGMGSVVGNEPHVVASLDLQVLDPAALHTISIMPGEGELRDGLLDLDGDSIDTLSISSNSISSHATSFLDLVGSANINNGQYVVSIQAKDLYGETALFDLPLLIGPRSDSLKYQQSLSSTLLRQMSPEAIAGLLKKSQDGDSSLSQSQQTALTALSNLNAIASPAMRSAIANGELYFSTNLIENTPLLAIYSEGSSSISSSSVVQHDASSLLTKLKEASGDIKTPVGALEFSMSTSFDSPVNIVNIALAEGGVQLNNLLKTTQAGDLKSFNVQTIQAPTNISQSDLDDWLQNLSYSIYDYTLDTSQSAEVGAYTVSAGLSSIGIPHIDLDLSQISSLDGSAYLIDFDHDGLTDLVSLALVDQGFFDLDLTPGFIKDPIVPIFDQSLSVNPTLNSVQLSSQLAYEPLVGRNTRALASGLSSSDSSGISGSKISSQQVIDELEPIVHQSPQDIIQFSSPDIEHDSSDESTQHDPPVLSDSVTELPSFTAGGSSSSTPIISSSSSPLGIQSLAISVLPIAITPSSNQQTQFEAHPSRSTVDVSQSDLDLASPPPTSGPSLTSYVLESIHSLFTLPNNEHENWSLPTNTRELLGTVLHDLADLGSSLLITLGLVSVPQASQLPNSAFKRIKKKYPLSILNRSQDSLLQVEVSGFDLSLSLVNGRIQISNSSSLSEFSTSTQPVPIPLDSLYSASASPGSFIHSCLSALQRLSSTNAQPINWSLWLSSLADPGLVCSSTPLSDQTKLQTTFHKIAELARLSPSFLDLQMAASITGLLVSHGYLATDLPGYVASI